MGIKIAKFFWELFLRFARILVLFWNKRKQFNSWMAQKYTPGMLASFGTLLCLAAVAFALFAAPCLGMANDSIGNNKMAEYGLFYREVDRGEDPGRFASNEYFTREYQVSRSDEPIHTSQNLFVKAAMALDALFTSDKVFDVRFLGLIYLLLYLPAVFLVLRSGMERVSFFSEAVAIMLLGAFIFADISYIAFFNSLYADPLIFICFLYIAGASMSLQKERFGQPALQLIAALAGLVLCLLERRFFLAGLLVAVLLVSQVRVLNLPSKIIAVSLASLVVLGSVFSFYWSGEEFDDISKVHSVTRGILLESQHPDQTLEEMGIDVSYSLLTDQSLYDYYPVSEIENPVLHKGFLDRFSTLDVALYYLQHPGALVSLWNNAIRSALSLRRDYCGNYERSTGMPPMAKSLFMSVWSAFRERSLPNTIGYLVLLIAVYTIMSGRKVFNRRTVQRWDYVYFITMLVITFIGMADITAVICRSGDSQLIQCNMTLGVMFDLLLYYVAAELLHKLNILEDKNNEQ